MGDSDVLVGMGFPRIWDLACRPQPRLLLEFLRWLVNDDERLLKAAASLEWVAVGFHVLHLAVRYGPDGTDTALLQANLYSEEYPGNEQPHGHGRDACAVWYALEGACQKIRRFQVLPVGAPRLPGVAATEFAAGVNCLETLGVGRLPRYNVVALSGRRLLIRLTETTTGVLTVEDFRSLGVHAVGFRGPGVGVSIHFKGSREASALSRPEGLIWVKGLTPAEAGHVRAMSPAAAGGPKTMVFAPQPGDLTRVSGQAPRPPIERAMRLLEGALHTAEQCAA